MHLVRVIDGKMLQVHLCATCAAEFGLRPPEGPGLEPGELMDTLKKMDDLGKDLGKQMSDVDLPDSEGGMPSPEALMRFLSRMGGHGEDEAQEVPPADVEPSAEELGVPDEQCPVCGMRLSRMLKTRACGCPACYDLLAKALAGDRRLRAHPYDGTIPYDLDPSTRQAVQLAQLEASLLKATCADDYETAARLRDEIALARRPPQPPPGSTATASPDAGEPPEDMDTSLQNLVCPLEARQEAPGEDLRLRASPSQPIPRNESGVVHVCMVLRRNLRGRDFKLELSAKQLSGLYEALAARASTACSPDEATRVVRARELDARLYDSLQPVHASQRIRTWIGGGERLIWPQGIGVAGHAVRLGVQDGAHVSLYADGSPAETANLREALRVAAIQCETRGARWAFHPRLGYLFRDLSRCGNGLEVHVLMHLPALHALGYIAPANEALEELGLALEPLLPVADLPPGHHVKELPFYWLGIPARFLLGAPMPADYGRTAETVVDDIMAAARALAHQDYEALQRLDPEWVADRYERAAATLATARRMGQFEAISVLSDLRMGEELDLPDGAVPTVRDAVLAPDACWAALRYFDPGILYATARAAKAVGLSEDKTPPEELREALLRARAGLFDFFLPDGDTHGIRWGCPRARAAAGARPKTRRKLSKASTLRPPKGETPPPPEQMLFPLEDADSAPADRPSPKKSRSTRKKPPTKRPPAEGDVSAAADDPPSAPRPPPRPRKPKGHQP